MQHLLPTTVVLPEGGSGRLHSLLHTFDSRVHLPALYTYKLVCDFSPLPFEWTVLLVVFTYITVRQVVLWYRFGLKPQTKGYVYWYMSDLIDVEYRESYKLEHHLNSAIIVYVTKKLWRDKPLTPGELNNKIFTIHLLSLHSNSVEDDPEEGESDENMEFRDHEELMLPVKLPIFPFWTSVHQGGVEMCTWITTLRVKNCYPEARRYVYLRARKDDATTGAGAKADAALRRFVDNAIAFYFAQGYADRNDCSLRTYCVSPMKNRILVKAFPLPLAPTFDTIFFRQRAAVRLQLQRFLELKGRYAIKGFPHKLGFLLYGPRGTGKRSFVRALAYHTQRHIVRVPLSTYTKNEHLYNTFHFEKAAWGSTEEWKLLNSKKVIFLLEDVDTESSVVRARDSSHQARMRRPRGLTTRDSHVKYDGNEPLFDLIHRVDKVSALVQERGRGEEEGILTLSTPRAASSTPQVPETPKVKQTRTRPAAKAQPQGGWGVLLAREDAKLDAIDLSSLLNVLDGVVEDPGRIVVMIADHPERLDPALLRPGRLATHLRFDYIELDDLIGLCGLFFGAERLFVRGALPNGAATTSVKSLCTGVCEYARVGTDDDVPPSFPHKKDDGSLNAHSEESALVCSDNVSLDWQRQEFKSSETARLDEQTIRQLSVAQAVKVRECIAALERENASRGNVCGNEGYNFFITPAHVHHLCMHSKSLDAFLTSLTAYIRRAAHAE